MAYLYEAIIYNLGLVPFYSIVIATFARFMLYYPNNMSFKESPWRPGPHTWALITGATDGIGLAFAEQLAAKGYNILLLSRNQTKLDFVKQQIESRHPNLEVRVLAVDFTQTDIYEKIESELKNLKIIDVLVNNVGITYPNECPEYFTEIPNLNQFISDIINVNIIACTRLTALVLPTMEDRGRGIVINVASIASLTPETLHTIYSSSKAFVDSFSRSLTQEYKDKGIIIQSLLPGLVKSNMTTEFHYNEWFMPTADRYVSSALQSVGISDQTSGYSGHKLHHLLTRLISFLGYITRINISSQLMHQFFLRHREQIKTSEAKGSVNQ